MSLPVPGTFNKQEDVFTVVYLQQEVSKFMPLSILSPVQTKFMKLLVLVVV